MNEQTMEDIISALYDMVQDARAVPWLLTSAFLSAIRFWICSMRSLRSCL